MIPIIHRIAMKGHMPFTDPRTVLSPKEHVSDVNVIRSTGEDGWAMALLRWDGEEVVALRWNGGADNKLGNPQSRGIPTWFVLPDEISAIVRQVYPVSQVDAFSFERVKLRPLPLRIWQGKREESKDDEWLVLPDGTGKDQLRLANTRTDHVLALYPAHIARVMPDPDADRKNHLKNAVLTLNIQVVFEDGALRVEHGAATMRDIVRRTTEFLNGMQQFERELKARIQALGGDPQIHIDWNHGRGFIPAPEAISIELRARDGRHTSAILSREQLEDSAERIDRADVVIAIDQLASHLTRPVAR